MVAALLDADVEHFTEHGWVLTRSHDDVAAVAAWVDEVAAWPDDGPWLHHRELTDAGPQLCRTENFVPFHEGLRALLTTGSMLATASALIGEPAVLYKEKINYKLPGGAGYAPHQDAPAYRFVETHVSCMVAVDDALIDNGCLEVVSGRHHELLAMDDAGCIRADVVAALDWAPVRGPRRRDALVPLPHPAPQRAQPRSDAAPRAVPHLQRPVRRRSAGGLLRAEAGRARRRVGRVAHRRLPGSAGDMTAQSIDEVLDLFERHGARALRRGDLPGRPRRADRRAGPGGGRDGCRGGRRAAARRRPPPRGGRARRGPATAPPTSATRPAARRGWRGCSRRPSPRRSRCTCAPSATSAPSTRATSPCSRPVPWPASSARAARWPPTRWPPSRPTPAGRTPSPSAAGTTRPRSPTSGPPAGPTAPSSRPSAR